MKLDELDVHTAARHEAITHTHTYTPGTHTLRLDVLAAGKFKVSQQFHQRRDKTRAAQAAVAASG